jgi:hypothetical protein
VFATASGKSRDRDNVRKRRGRSEAPVPHVVPRTLRWTYISLMLGFGLRVLHHDRRALERARRAMARVLLSSGNIAVRDRR